MSPRPHPPRARRNRKEPLPDEAQLNLFDVMVKRCEDQARKPEPSPTPVPVTPSQQPAIPGLTSQAKGQPRRKLRCTVEQTEVRMLTLADMPDYPPELHGIVDRILDGIKDAPLLLTYRDIRARFGISRATVARRVQDGLIPSIRIANGRVLEDGAVRRFDRTQIRWLLLAVRFSGSID